MIPGIKYAGWHAVKAFERFVQQSLKLLEWNIELYSIQTITSMHAKLLNVREGNLVYLEYINCPCLPFYLQAFCFLILLSSVRWTIPSKNKPVEVNVKQPKFGQERCLISPWYLFRKYRLEAFKLVHAEFGGTHVVETSSFWKVVMQGLHVVITALEPVFVFNGLSEVKVRKNSFRNFIIVGLLFAARSPRQISIC